jgi:hypothetical protein
MGTHAKIQVGTQIYLGKSYLTPNTGAVLAPEVHPLSPGFVKYSQRSWQIFSNSKMSTDFAQALVIQSSCELNKALCNNLESCAAGLLEEVEKAAQIKEAQEVILLLLSPMVPFTEPLEAYSRPFEALEAKSHVEKVVKSERRIPSLWVRDWYSPIQRFVC